MKLTDKLNSLSSYPFHMPGHKRNDKFNIIGSDIDITEIDGFDNLHNPQGIILDIENRLADIYKAEKSIISVNGSTCCVLSAICAVCDYNDDIIIARNCHKSVYNACTIKRLNITYIETEFDEEYGIYTHITQDSIDEVIRNNPNAKAIVITSPTYEGFVSNIKADIPVIIDAAHGSHFGLADYLPSMQYADIVINSLHKTLPALTQTACINIYNKKYVKSVKDYMDIFETSSPSYILMSSVDKCVDFISSCDNEYKKYKLLLDDFYNKVKLLDNITIIKNDDISRICINAYGYSGKELCEYLRANGIEAEGYGINYVILISTVCDTEYGFELLLTALKNLPVCNDDIAVIKKPEIPAKACATFEINSSVATPINEATGKVCAEYIFAYPPASPIIAKGEIITQEIIDFIKHLIDIDINIISDSNLLPNSILTKAD